MEYHDPRIERFLDLIDEADKLAADIAILSDEEDDPEYVTEHIGEAVMHVRHASNDLLLARAKLLHGEAGLKKNRVVNPRKGY